MDAAQSDADTEKIKEIYERIAKHTSGDTHSSLLNSRVDSFDGHHRTGGLHFRLGCLQRSIGPLDTGDFGIIFARTEVGKTTFVADQGAHFLTQVKGPIAWLINEERGSQYLRRIVQAYVGWTREEMDARADELKEIYEKEIKHRLFLIHNPNIHYRDAHALFREIRPGLIILDQIDKIKGFKADRNDLQLGATYEWARTMAHEFAPAIAVTQAAESAEGKQWLQSNDMAESKTSKPAEADWIIGIGKQHAEAMKSVRHLHIIKNKLAGDANTIEEYRHGKFDVIIEPELARFRDTMKWD